jgi:hypothetical protein
VRESLQRSQVDRLGEAHAAVEQSNSYSALPNRPTKVRLGMGLRGNIFAVNLLSLSSGLVSGSPSNVHSGIPTNVYAGEPIKYSKVKKKKPHIQGEMTCQCMVSVSLIFSAKICALVIVTQILPAKSKLSSVF